MYVVKKHEGSWAVSVEDRALLLFDSYAEAVETAAMAAAVLAARGDTAWVTTEGDPTANEDGPYASTTTYRPSTLTRNVSAT